MIKTKEAYDAYMDAVDTVCIECAFTEEICKKCPVRVTVNTINNNFREAHTNDGPKNT